MGHACGSINRSSYKLSGSSIAGRQYAGVIQNSLKEVGIPVEIQTPEQNTFLDELKRGNFQISYSQWVGGNQDPIFYKDLFATLRDPDRDRDRRAIAAVTVTKNSMRC